MKNLLGIGGESIVFKKIIEDEEKALKMAPYENISTPEITIVQNAMKKPKAIQSQISPISPDRTLSKAPM